MTFSVDCGLISSFLEELGERLLIPIEGITIVHEAVFVAMLTGLNHRSTRPANGIGAEAVDKQHSFLGQFIDRGSRVD